MKLTIDLDETYGFDDEAVGPIIRAAINDELQRWARKVVREAVESLPKDRFKAAIRAQWERKMDEVTR